MTNRLFTANLIARSAGFARAMRVACHPTPRPLPLPVYAGGWS